MDLWSHDRFTFPLPATHRFPLAKYARLVSSASSGAVTS